MLGRAHMILSQPAEGGCGNLWYKRHKAGGHSAFSSRLRFRTDSEILDEHLYQLVRCYVQGPLPAVKARKDSTLAIAVPLEHWEELEYMLKAELCSGGTCGNKWEKRPIPPTFSFCGFILCLENEWAIIRGWIIAVHVYIVCKGSWGKAYAHLWFAGHRRKIQSDEKSKNTLLRTGRRNVLYRALAMMA